MDTTKHESPHGEVVTGISIGSVLAGKYRVEQVLGSGGMGVVLKATHLELREAVAIKVLLPEVSQHPEATARFIREARAAARFKSEHVARTTDVGTLENGQRYMVMEYLQGADLSTILAEKGPLSVRRALGYVLQVCDAVAEAHQLGIVHRDLKPANLFVVPQSGGLGLVKVLDFGVSKAIDLESTRNNVGMLTRTHSMVGTPIYASPEQLMSAGDVDERTDVWALGGVVLYELLAGRPPFSGETMEELVSRVIASPPDPIKAFRPDVPVQVERIILSCLEKDRNRRLGSIGELVQAILAARGTDLDAESQVLASRIVRRHNSNNPPAPMSPSEVETVESADAPHQDLPGANAPRNLDRSEPTKVSDTGEASLKRPNSTSAGVYSSHPAVPGIRSAVVRTRTIVGGSIAVMLLSGVIIVQRLVKTFGPSQVATSALIAPNLATASPALAAASIAPAVPSVPTLQQAQLAPAPLASATEAAMPSAQPSPLVVPRATQHRTAATTAKPTVADSQIVEGLQPNSRTLPKDRQGNPVAPSTPIQNTLDFGPRR